MPLLVLLYAYAAFVGKTIESIAWAYTLNEVITIVIAYYVLFVKVMHVSLWPVIKSLITPLIYGCLLVGFYLFYNMVIPSEIYHIIHLILKLLIGGIYILAILKITKQFDALTFFRTKIKKEKI